MFTWYQGLDYERVMAMAKEAYKQWEERERGMPNILEPCLDLFIERGLIPKAPGFTLVESFEDKDEEIRSMMVFKDTVYVATTKRVGVLRDGAFRPLQFEIRNT